MPRCRPAISIANVFTITVKHARAYDVRGHGKSRQRWAATARFHGGGCLQQPCRSVHAEYPVRERDREREREREREWGLLASQGSTPLVFMLTASLYWLWINRAAGCRVSLYARACVWLLASRVACTRAAHRMDGRKKNGKGADAEGRWLHSYAGGAFRKYAKGFAFPPAGIKPSVPRVHISWAVTDFRPATYALHTWARRDASSLRFTWISHDVQGFGTSSSSIGG